MSYRTIKFIEINKSVNYVGFPGLVDKLHFIVGKKEINKDERTLMFLCDKILSFYELDLNKVLIPSRQKLKVRAKYMCYYILHNKFAFAKVQIGRTFKVDHTTVMHGITSIEEQLYINNSVYYSELQSILTRLN